MADQFSRTERVIGTEAILQLKKSRVAIFGVGGVGGYAVEALARSGVGTLDLIDSDTIAYSNLNRQIIATHETIGQPKVEAFAERIHSICPDTIVNTHQIFYLPDSADQFDFHPYDYIIDAIDTVTAKIDLILQAQQANCPIISAMGCGNRMDPTCLRVSDINQTSMDPLSKIIRKELRKRGVPSLKVVWSTEPPIRPFGIPDPDLQPQPSAQTEFCSQIGSGSPANFCSLAGSDSPVEFCSLAGSGSPVEFCSLAGSGSPASSNAQNDPFYPNDSHNSDKPASRPRQAPGSTAFVPAAAGLIIASEVVRDLTHFDPAGRVKGGQQ